MLGVLNLDAKAVMRTNSHTAEVASIVFPLNAYYATVTPVTRLRNTRLCASCVTYPHKLYPAVRFQVSVGRAFSRHVWNLWNFQNREPDLFSG